MVRVHGGQGRSLDDPAELEGKVIIVGAEGSEEFAPVVSVAGGTELKVLGELAQVALTCVAHVCSFEIP